MAQSRKKKRKRRFCARGTVLQSVLLEKAIFDRNAAKKWLRQHDFHSTLDTTANTHRARQVDSSHFVRGTFRTIRLRPGVQAVIGCPKA